MALYEIKEDCRIANKNYSKGDVVSNEEVWGFFPTVMKAIDWKKDVVEKVVEEKEEVVEEVKEVKETPKASAKKWQSKKK